MPTNPPIPACTYAIEPAGWRDLNQLRSLEQACFPVDAWPLLDLIGILTFPNVLRLKATCEGRMIGFVACDIRHSQQIAWVATIGVLPAYRRQGIGEALLQACEVQLTTPCIRLCVRISNQTAIHLYERNGYNRVETWRQYYQDKEDALVMEKIR